MRLVEASTPVPLSSPESLPPVSKCGLTAAPLLYSLWTMGPLTPRVPRVSDPYLGFGDLNAYFDVVL